jgi:hypothetical protein
MPYFALSMAWYNLIYFVDFLEMAYSFTDTIDGRNTRSFS